MNWSVKNMEEIETYVSGLQIKDNKDGGYDLT